MKNLWKLEQTFLINNNNRLCSQKPIFLNTYLQLSPITKL